MANIWYSPSTAIISNKHSPALFSSTTTKCTVYKSCSSLSCFQQNFPFKLRCLIHSRQRSPTLPLVQAKNQTSSSFDELITNSDKLVLVDFYATWCGPCQFMVPILEQVNAYFNGKIQMVKIDTEMYREIADKYKIAALPTFILFKDGEPCDRFVGALPADKLVERIVPFLTIDL